MKLYHELAEYYYSIEDKHRDINDDISLITDLLNGFEGARILDLGCGTGEHINLLGKKGFRCTGLDNSKDMLAIARARFPDAGEFINSDMMNFDYYEEFQMVVSLFGSFNYITSNEDVDRVFWNTWRALRSGGIGLFEIWNSIPLQRIKEKRPGHVSTTIYDDTIIDRERGFNLLNYPDRSMVEVNYTYKIKENESEKLIKDRHIMRSFTKEEISKFILNNGFVIRNIFSNTKGDKYDSNSNRIIVHFEKI